MIGRRWRGARVGLRCAAVVCALLLLAGCGQRATGGATAVVGTPTRGGTPGVGASPATPVAQATAPLRVDNASGTPRPW